MKTWFLILLLLISLAGRTMLAQNTPWDIIYCLNGGENKSVGISKLPFANPLEKPGWNLIFNDEFNSASLDPGKWNRSTPWDDGNGTCNRGFAANPENTSVEDGHARITNTTGSQLPGCPYSYGEIKTMSVSDTMFDSYYFYAPGYLETRVKLFTKTGQGAACWLWGIGTPENPGTPGPWNEIDVFELNGVNSNIFNGAYHWTYNGLHVSQHQAIYLTDSAQLYDLAENWTTFGLEWDSMYVRWYVNNILIKELDLTRVPPYCISAAAYKPPAAPFCLRMNTGNNSVGNQSGTPNPADFPQSMLVDYVRVYKKEGHIAAPIIITGGVEQICITEQSPASSNKTIASPYYPEATYQWSSPAFEMEELPAPPPQPPGKKVIWIKPGTVPGQSYPVYLETLFPGNYQENDTAYFYVAQDVPGLPSGDFTAVQVDSLCRFTLKTPPLGNISGCDFSLDTGLTWHAVTLMHEGGNTLGTFGSFKPGQNVNFGFRGKNGCGSSPPGFYSLTMPAPPQGCKWPTGTVEPPRGTSDISLTPNPFTTSLQIVISKIPGPVPEDMRITIHDIYARKIVDQPISVPGLTLDLGRLGQGMYFLKILTESEMIFCAKILKR